MSNKSINCNGQLLELDRPLVMGILNVTPDSFYDGGKYTHKESIKKRLIQLIEDGADIIDVGGMSSRPGAEIVDPKVELNRLATFFEVIETLNIKIPISVDTCQSLVAKKALSSGASIINDISGGNFDPNIIDVAIDNNAPFVMMHMRGTPTNMQSHTDYDNLTLEILKYFKDKIYEYRKKGLKDIIVDPGFGFSKTIDQNYQLVNKTSIFRLTDCPILAGISRKGMTYKFLNIDKKDALNATTAIHMRLLNQGVSILRVHDVKEAKEAIAIHEKLKIS